MVDVKETTIKYAGTTVGVGTGNALAYFGLWYASAKHGIIFDDPALAMVMAGTLVGGLLLELKKIGKGLKYIFDRLFPEAHDHGDN